MIDTIVSVVKALSGLQDSLRQSDTEHRSQIAEYFRKVSTCLHEMATNLRSGTVSHGQFAALEIYALALPNTLGETIERDKANALTNQLLAFVESLSISAQLAPSIDSNMALLDYSAGVLSALADTVTIGPRSAPPLFSNVFRYSLPLLFISLLGGAA